MPLLRRRRNRETNTEARATVLGLAAEVYEEGDTPATLKKKMLAEINNSDESRPFLKALIRWVDALLPLLIKLLTGTAIATLLLILLPALAFAAPPVAADALSVDAGFVVTPDAPELGKVEIEMVASCNAFRARLGLPALEPAKWLMDKAREHTARMVRSRSMFHSAFGLRENVAMGQRDAVAVTNVWANSPGHRANMASHEKYVGVAGYSDGSGGTYWTQVFASIPEPRRVVAIEKEVAGKAVSKARSAGRRLFGRLRR